MMCSQAKICDRDLDGNNNSLWLINQTMLTMIEESKADRPIKQEKLWGDFTTVHLLVWATPLMKLAHPSLQSCFGEAVDNFCKFWWAANSFYHRQLAYIFEMMYIYMPLCDSSKIQFAFLLYNDSIEDEFDQNTTRNAE